MHKYITNISNNRNCKCLKHAHKHWIFFCTNVLANWSQEIQKSVIRYSMCYITSTPETKYITNALPYQPKNATSKIYSSWPGAETQNIMTISKTKEILTCPDQNALALYLRTSTSSTIYLIFNRKLATVYGSYLSNTKKFIKSSIVIAKTTLTDSN